MQIPHPTMLAVGFSLLLILVLMAVALAALGLVLWQTLRKDPSQEFQEFSRPVPLSQDPEAPLLTLLSRPCPLPQGPMTHQQPGPRAPKPNGLR